MRYSLAFNRSSHQRCFVKKVFSEISQNSHENTWETLAQVFYCEFCETLKNTFLHRTPLVAASVSLNSDDGI